MPKDGRRPYTELFEVVQNELVREAAADEEDKYKGQVNQTYINELSTVLPEKYIQREGWVTLAAEYTTGTVTVGSGTTNIVGNATAWTSANVHAANIKVSGHDIIYRMAYEAGTSLTFTSSLTWTSSSGSGLAYSVFQNVYALTSAFDYMIADNPDSPNVVFTFNNGAKVFAIPVSNEEYMRKYTFAVQDQICHYTVVLHTDGLHYLGVWPNPLTADIVGFTYIPRLTEMREHTTGTATFTTGTDVILSADATPTTSLTTTDALYIRNDADGTGSSSLWFKITTVDTNSTLTLSANFTGTSGAGITYTISEISKWPSRFDDSILFKTAFILDPDGMQQEKWGKSYESSVAADKTVEAKRKRGHRMKYFPGARR